MVIQRIEEGSGQFEVLFDTPESQKDLIDLVFSQNCLGNIDGKFEVHMNCLDLLRNITGQDSLAVDEDYLLKCSEHLIQVTHNSLRTRTKKESIDSSESYLMIINYIYQQIGAQVEDFVAKMMPLLHSKIEESDKYRQTAYIILGFLVRLESEKESQIILEYFKDHASKDIESQPEEYQISTIMLATSIFEVANSYKGELVEFFMRCLNLESNESVMNALKGICIFFESEDEATSQTKDIDTFANKLFDIVVNRKNLDCLLASFSLFEILFNEIDFKKFMGKNSQKIMECFQLTGDFNDIRKNLICAIIAGFMDIMADDEDTRPQRKEKWKQNFEIFHPIICDFIQNSITRSNKMHGALTYFTACLKFYPEKAPNDLLLESKKFVKNVLKLMAKYDFGDDSTEDIVLIELKVSVLYFYKSLCSKKPSFFFKNKYLEEALVFASHTVPSDESRETKACFDMLKSVGQGYYKYLTELSNLPKIEKAITLFEDFFREMIESVVLKAIKNDDSYGVVEMIVSSISRLLSEVSDPEYLIVAYKYTPAIIKEFFMNENLEFGEDQQYETSAYYSVCDLIKQPIVALQTLEMYQTHLETNWDRILKLSKTNFCILEEALTVTEQSIIHCPSSRPHIQALILSYLESGTFTHPDWNNVHRNMACVIASLFKHEPIKSAHFLKLSMNYLNTLQNYELYHEYQDAQDNFLTSKMMIAMHNSIQSKKDNLDTVRGLLEQAKQGFPLEGDTFENSSIASFLVALKEKSKNDFVKNLNFAAKVLVTTILKRVEWDIEGQEESGECYFQLRNLRDCILSVVDGDSFIQKEISKQGCDSEEILNF